ncbi:MAG TPA: hypothetical protein VE261_02915, partial [Gaiellaceae bacterium]|nr:hypothetical protein [Gaiellaceae bacterium]
CRKDARTFAQDALLFLGHSGPNASYPADLYYIDLRGVYYDFEAHDCSPAYLGGALDESLSAAQRRKLAADLPEAMAATVRAALAHSSG